MGRRGGRKEGLRCVQCAIRIDLMDCALAADLLDGQPWLPSCCTQLCSEEFGYSMRLSSNSVRPVKRGSSAASKHIPGPGPVQIRLTQVSYEACLHACPVAW